MTRQRFRYSTDGHKWDSLEFTRDIHMPYGETDAFIQEPVNHRAIDLVRIAAAVYAVDRICLRPADSNRWREVWTQIDVFEPDFWTANASKLEQIIALLSGGDAWHLKFSGIARPDCIDGPALDYGNFNRVCLFSGGLDSVSGLAASLRESDDRILAITALHQPKQYERIRFQCNVLNRRYSGRVSNAGIRANLIHPPPWNQQENSQRCRSFLFASLAIAHAVATGAERIEVYESGVGAVNLPLTIGMMLGSATTRSCHPGFLRKMSEIGSVICERPVKFTLPWIALTKAEVVRGLKDDRLDELAVSSVSCAHYPLHEKPARVCGVCLACIGRRQALALAGIAEPKGHYKYDFLDPGGANEIPTEQLRPLCAVLAQAYECLRPNNPKLESHVRATDVLGNEIRFETIAQAFERYGREWLELAERARRSGIHWGELLSAPLIAKAA
ncbi:MAG TPA: 7-cyano-7-deazaguanine synthase [Planctomycetota bacterium]|nr:7-cyano-7-deazaguanine synthase [Planctomycetota bacterium]